MRASRLDPACGPGVPADQETGDPIIRFGVGRHADGLRPGMRQVRRDFGLVSSLAEPSAGMPSRDAEAFEETASHADTDPADGPALTRCQQHEEEEGYAHEVHRSLRCFLRQHGSQSLVGHPV